MSNTDEKAGARTKKEKCASGWGHRWCIHCGHFIKRLDQNCIALAKMKCGHPDNGDGWLSQDRVNRGRFGVKHGYKGTRTYMAWHNMKKRCAYPSPNYKNYTGNITVSDEWKSNFLTFLHDMGEAPVGKSLDRIDNLKGYSKENCRWATLSEQATNTRKTRLVTIGGETLCVTHWARKIGVSPSCFRYREKKGWPIEKVIAHFKELQHG